MRKNKNSLLFSHVICKRLFTANKEVLENLKKMEKYNLNKEYDKTVDLYNVLYYKQRIDPKIRFQYNHAIQSLKIFDGIVYSTIFGNYTRSSRYFLLLFFVMLNAYAIYYWYEHYYLNNISIFGNSTKSKKKNQGDSSKGNSGIFKLLETDMNFDISFAHDMKERLNDVKGIDEVKEEIEQLIKMIQFPKKYINAGAKLHKGILLSGKPGTGKTLIARAIAGESKVNFIFLTGSDFDEMFVGVGASRIRKLFKKAREHKPCIIFIDEIDTLLAKSRRQSMEHSSSRSTLNQFLGEMDGFDKMEEVFVIGATNHEKDLDPAAIRPGRFDKTIHINVPDENGRNDIINFYLDRINLRKDKIDSKYVSRMTPGFTGAEIENLINLSIINAVNLQKEEVDMNDISEARDRVLMGISRKHFTSSDKAKFMTSVHESGHTLICYINHECRRKLQKVTIIPRGGAAGVTFMLTDEEALNSKHEFLVDIDVSMGGHVAEELLNGSENITAGCSSDLNKATQLAQAMVKKLGMYGDKVGYIYVEDEGYSWEEDKISEKYKSSIDEQVKQILKESHDRVYEQLKTHANDLKNLSQQVFKYDTLDFVEIEAVMEGRIKDITRDIVREDYVEGKEEKENEKKEKEKREQEKKEQEIKSKKL